MTANRSTSVEEESADGIDTQDAENRLHTEVVVPSERQDLPPEALAEALRKHADALDSEGYETYHAGP